MSGEKTPTVLLLPGMSLNATIFPDFGFPAVEPNLELLGPVEPDLGGRSHPIGLARHQRRLEEAIAESQEWASSRRFVVAHSFGGMLALHWLTESREIQPDIDGLVLIGTTAGPMYQRVRPLIRNPWGAKWRFRVDWLVRFWNRPQAIKLVKRRLCKGRLDGDLQDFGKLRITSDRELVLAGWRNTDWRAIHAYRMAMLGFDVRDRLGDMTVPTIVLHGTEDSLFAEADAHCIASALPRAEVRLVDGAGHALPVTHGEEVNRALGDLVDS